MKNAYKTNKNETDAAGQEVKNPVAGQKPPLA